MSVRSYLGMNCDLCGASLKVFEINDEDTGGLVPGLTRSAPAIFGGESNVITVSGAAARAGWSEDEEDGRAGRVISRWTCRMCVGRARSMHSWIRTNKVIDDVG